MNKSTHNDLYSILEITRSASDNDIKKAYRRLAMIWHPDKNKSPEAKIKFQEITNAYTILSNPEKKNNYDNFGSDEPSHSIDPRDIFSHVFSSSNTPFSGIFGRSGFSDFFSGFNQPVFRKKGLDTQKRISINIIQMMNGDTIKIKHSRNIACDFCLAQGFSKNGDFICPSCKGTKQTTQHIRLGPGAISTQVSPCRTCNSSGKVIPDKDKCTHCKGSCIIKNIEEFTIDIPKGSRNNETITFTGKGDYDPSNMHLDSEYGDLVFIFNEENNPNDKWQRIDFDLFIIHDILLSEALCGIDKKFNHPDGNNYRVIHNSVILPGTKHKIPGLGFPNSKGERGDLIISFNIKFPKELSEKQKEFLLKLLPKRRDLTDDEKTELTDIYLEPYDEPKTNNSDLPTDYDETNEMKECIIS